ncbi:hypothetical protein CO675_07855 [Bradyrhizobium sp. C9]|nr:hypothetical protein CO675_07855 [Bradyrhizobium sp. C9]
MQWSAYASRMDMLAYLHQCWREFLIELKQDEVRLLRSRSERHLALRLLPSVVHSFSSSGRPRRNRPNFLIAEDVLAFCSGRKAWSPHRGSILARVEVSDVLERISGPHGIRNRRHY